MWKYLFLNIVRRAYLHNLYRIPSSMSMGPVADRIFNGWPEKSENIIPLTAPDKTHSTIPYEERLF